MISQRSFVEDFWDKVVLGWRKPLFFAFVFGFIVRLIPELLSFPYPIGYDPIYYAWRIKGGVVWYNWSWMFSTWMLYAVLIGLFNITRLDPFVLVKFAGALLFGFNACGIYHFATKALGWTTKKGLLASVFFSLQIAALAFSSNFYRNMLGLGILFFALPLVKDDSGSSRRSLTFVLLSVLVVLSHELSSVILFAVVLAFLAKWFLQGKRTKMLKVLMTVFPAFVLFLVSVYFVAFPIPCEVEKNVAFVREPRGNYPGALFFFRNYLVADETSLHVPVYLDFVSQVLSVFGSLYIVILPLILAGVFKDNVLNCWVALLLIGAFGALVMPQFALDYWYWWMLMLAYPFTFYAVNGFTKVLQSIRETRVKWRTLSERVMKMTLMVPFLLSFVFMATAMQGRAVPFCDTDDTRRAIEWLDTQMDGSSVLLTHAAFSNWARFYLNERHALIYFRDDIEGAINVASQRGFDDIYLIWWNETSASYSLTIPSGFISVFHSGRISVFRFC